VGNSEKVMHPWSRFYEVAGHVWVDLKLKSRTSYVRRFEVTRQQYTRLRSG